MLSIVAELAGECVDLAGVVGTEALEAAGRPLVTAEAVAKLREAREALTQARAALRRAREAQQPHAG